MLDLPKDYGSLVGLVKGQHKVLKDVVVSPTQHTVSHQQQLVQLRLSAFTGEWLTTPSLKLDSVTSTA